ncbi:MAG: EAL domain-containing protein [Rhodoferax sp.]|nr:EAL domain-containing protein [Rhodoferax sp.]
MDPLADACSDSSQWSEDGNDPLTELAAMLEVLRRRCAVDFSGYKTSTLSRRIRQRMARSEVNSAQAYLQRITDDEQECRTLCSDLLVNVTEFFRDAAVFTQLADEVLPDLLRGRDASDELRIWSAACANGEEAYSLAMLALEAASRMGFHGNVKVFATDLAADALTHASRGSYSAQAVAAVPEALLRRYFQRDPQGGARVDATLRRHVVFARHNLLSDPPFTRIDLAVCRNLLIYLKPAAQLKALSQLHFSLKPHGLLLLGASETVGEFEARAFSPVDRSNKLFRKQTGIVLRAAEPQTLGAQVVPNPNAQPLPAVSGQAPEVLAAELLATRERLHEMVLELQASHERVDLSNEELIASNEELQSTNEELKSVNEDLYALNRELEAKNNELAALNQDYDRLLASTEIGTVFLDADLRLRRFSPAVEDFLALRPADLGRPVSDISYRLGSQSTFHADLQRCLNTGARIEREAQLSDGRWVFERMLPYTEDRQGGHGVVLTWTDISEVKRIQTLAEHLATERTRLLGILDALPDGVYIVSPEHEIEYLNPALEREFGPVNARKCFEYFHDRTDPCTWCKNPQVLAGQSVHWEWTSPKGRTFDLFDMPFHNPDGTVSKFEIFHDITDLKESKRGMKEAARLAQVGHWDWNITNGALHWSEETYHCFGYEPGAVTPSFELFAQHIDPQDRAMVQAAVQSALEQGSDYLAEFRFHRADGSARIGRATGRVTRNAQGVPLSMSGAMQDVTVLRQSEEQFKVAFRASPLAASIARLADGVFIEANTGYERFFGWSREEMVGHSALELGFWPNAEARQAWIHELQKTGTVVGYETPLYDKSGRVRQAMFSCEIITIDGVEHILSYVQDVTERKETEARIEFLAHHDPLTSLPNRVLFRDRFSLATAWAERSSGKVALLYVDLDHFKTINDTLGHPVGDQLLQQVAQRLRECVRDTDTISRQGGDEFLLALTDIDNLDTVSHVATKVLDKLAAPFQIEGHELAASLSMGVAVWPDDGQDFDALLQRADTAMYQAKAAGRNTYRFYTAEMNAQALENLQLRTALHRALANQEFVLHYQPQVDLVSGHVVGVEALLRWQRGSGELLAPGRFVPAAEESGLIVPIGEWVLREACQQAMRWQRAGLPELTVAVNLSAVQFRRGDLQRSVTQALIESGLEPARLELELTETLLIDDVEHVLETLRHLKALGVCLSIDDFGTGYSSLGYLERFAVDKLKIDQSFVRDIVSDPDDAAIVRAIISMARSLKLKVIAEGVESADAASFLSLYHCHEAQGYHFARPMPAEALADWLLARSAAG